MKIIEIPVDQIDVGERLRALDEDWVGVIAASIEARGLFNPITIGPPRAGCYPLIAGRHRLAAVARIGWTEIPAISMEVDALGKRFVELSENLFRRELNPIDHAAHLAELKRVWELLHPHQKLGAKGMAAIVRLREQAEKRRPGAHNAHLDEDGQDQGVTDHPSDETEAQGELPFATMAASKLGLSAQHIRKLVSIHRTLQPDVASAISTLPIADKMTEVLALSRLVQTEQRAVAAVLREKPHLTSVKQILALIYPADTKPTLSKAERADSALRAAWAKAPDRVRRAFIRHLAATGSLARYVSRELFDEDQEVKR